MARVLIVDDAAFMRLMLKGILIKAGHEIVGEASNGMEAIEEYNRLQPDIVTMDITMPVMNGIDAVKKIRENHSKAKIIMCSAVGQQQMVTMAIVAGAKDFVVKPFEGDRVIKALENALK
ncbi:response regulator [Paenibacillus agricola]|uniref:Response regulator n=1 Tax=Paenibacillus agricola TaxID=2716264 RepID=A0ABX0JGL2_9BACL|nr:response regulator [Paenibacillus agricola]NHN32805.1 response regulator [Paenibacillus agricola]